MGLEALHKYLQVKSVVTPIYNSPWLWMSSICIK
jgi:coniferyl-aldehyde dehydrogenase